MGGRRDGSDCSDRVRGAADHVLSIGGRALLTPLGAWKGTLAARDVQEGSLPSGGRVAKTASDGSSIVYGTNSTSRRSTGSPPCWQTSARSSLLRSSKSCRGASRDPAICLLWALNSLSESDSTLRRETAQAELALADLLQDEDSDVREAAAEAMRLLRPERAVRWLEHRLRRDGRRSAADHPERTHTAPSRRS